MNEMDGSPFPRIKTCKSCRETIHFDAVKCPKCQAFQIWWKNPQYISLLFIPLPLLFFFFIPNSPFKAKPKFESFRALISVTDSQFFFSRENGNVEITTLVKIRNDSPYRWEHPTIEVQYFNADGKLIDTQSDQNYSSVLVPGTEQAFRFRTKPAKPETEYASQKIFVRSADAPIFSE